MSTRLPARPVAARYYLASISGEQGAEPFCAERFGTAPFHLIHCCFAKVAIILAKVLKFGVLELRLMHPTEGKSMLIRKPEDVSMISQRTSHAWSKPPRTTGCQEELYKEVRQNFHGLLEGPPQRRSILLLVRPHQCASHLDQGQRQKLWGFNPDDLKGKLPPYLPDVPEVREDLADYFGEIAAWDACIGVLIDELSQQGLRDNTLIVISGDHGAPGFPHGKCNLYGFGTGVSLAISGPGVAGGRVVDDFVCLPDLAPTFLEAGGVTVPAAMTGRSLWPVLKSRQEGLVDPQRTFVITGRERHVENARADYAPYPQRALRTKDYVLIINFHPERYPLGDPYGLDSSSPPTSEQITKNTRATLPDEDAGPTKAWLVGMRDSAE